MNIPRSVIAEIVEKCPRFSRRAKRHSIARLSKNLRQKLRKDITQHMQPWMVLLDECVQFFIHFERLQWSRKFTKETSAFAMQVARLRSDVLSIRELVELGQDSPAQALGRVFLDDLELAMVFVIDPNFAILYMNEDIDHDETRFWKENIGYGRIYKRVEQFFLAGGGDTEDASRQIDYHKAAKNNLSHHIHPSPATTLRGLATPSLVRPGLIAIRSLGHLSAHMPGFCQFVAHQTHTFSACVINQMIKESAPAALHGYRRGGVMDDMIASATVLQELLVRYESELELARESHFGPIEEGSN